MRCHRQSLTVTLQLVRPGDDGPDRGGAEATSLPPSIDGEVPQLATIDSVSEGEYPDGRTLSVTDEERLPPRSSWTDVALGQDHEGDRLVIGHEGELVIGNAHFERLSPVARVDQLEVYMCHGSIQLPDHE